MKKRSVLSVAFYILLPFLLLFAACSGGNSGGGSEPMASVGITLKQSENVQSKSKVFAAPKTETITSLAITVTSEDGNELARNTASVTPGTTVTLTLNVPVGVNRIFTAEAFDVEGQVILFGDATTDLQEGQDITLTIPVEAPLQIAPENPTINLAETQVFTATRSLLLNDALQWSVDDIVGGDAILGTITETGDTTAEYIAPTTLPTSAQVSVRVASADNPNLYFDETLAFLNDPSKTFFVDPLNGVDNDDCGPQASPCRTLTQALSLVEAGGTVLLLPGNYVFGNGTGNETLPLQMKVGVTIHGTTQGRMALLDFTDPQTSGPGILGADNAILSGMRIETRTLFGNLIETNGTSPTIQNNLFFGACDLSDDDCNTAIFVDQASAPNISRNTFGAIGPNAFSVAIYIVDQAAPQVTDNTFTGNQIALLIQGDAEPRIENNRILENMHGILAQENALPDLGGGAAGSAGLNILSCNTRVDLFNQTSNSIVAQNNQWDHLPPEVFSTPGDGADIVFTGGSVDASNATLYPFAPCNLGVQVSAPSPNFTTESSGTASFDVVLGTEPSADVVIALSSTDTSEGTLSNNSLTFTTQNWNVSQTVIVTGVDDAVADGPVSYQIEFDLSGSLDLVYQQGETPAPIDLFNTDDETPGITVSPISGLVTDETGLTDTFTIVLDSAPTADVTITLASDDQTEGLAAPSTLVFTTSNWNSAQTVTLTGQDDNVADGDVSYNIVTTVSTSDAVYAAIDPDDVSVTNNDAGDIAGIRVTPILGLITTEAGGTDTFDVVLTSEPTADVDISLSSSDVSEGTISTDGLTFTAQNWNVAQTVTVTGVNDAVVDGNILYTVNISAASSTDPNYSGMPVNDVSVSNTDDDTRGITLSRTTGLVTDEGAASDTFTVVLNSQPTASVSIGLSSSDTTEGNVSPGSVSFDASNWSTPQTVTVTGVDDDVVDGNIAYTIVTAAASSPDPTYAGFDAADVSVSNTDDDVIGIVVNPTTGLVTTEAGGGATFTVVLSSEPTADVNIALSSSDGTEGSVSPPSLTFSASNWSTAQTVTITGVNDNVDDGDVAYTIVTAAASSADTAYNGINPADVSVSNTDNDTSGIRLDKTTVVTDESGTTTDQFTIVLDSEPTADVSIALASSDGTEGSVLPTSLLFTTSNWNTAQAVTVSGVDDDVADGNIAYTITTNASSSDAIYGGINPSDVSATNNDDDVVGITLTPTSGLVTSEAPGGTATFDVVLTSEPTANVNIPLSSSDTSEGTISTSSLSFDTTNWNTPQTVTITGVDDALADGPVSYTIVTGAASGGDYAGFDAADVSVTNNDNDIVGITVNPTAGLISTEAGGQATFTIVLNTQPTADVVIGLSSSLTTEGLVSPSSLTFTSGNWSTAQTVTITGVDDMVDDGDIVYTIVTAAVVSADTTGFSGFNADDVSVTNTDDDAGGITLSRTTGLVTDEGATSDTFTVVLNSQPTASVSIGLSSSDTTEGNVSPGSVSFDASNWSTPQTVTVTGVDDDIVDGNIAYTIITAVASSTDLVYNGVDASDVSVTNNDNDVIGIVVNPTTGLVTTEAGGGATFTVVLSSEPTGDVNVGLSSSDTTEGTISTASLTFTAQNWNTAQTVSITGVNDFVVDGDIAYTITTAAATSADSNYNGFDPANVSVSNTDDDTAAINVVPTSGLVTTESGGNATFTVVLGSQPTHTVILGLLSDTPGEGTVSPSSLTFTSSTWNMLQTVTVTGVDDFVVDGNIVYTIVTAAASSTDPNYSGLNASDVTVTNNDNDTAGITVNPVTGLETTEAGGTDTFTVVLDTQPTGNTDVTVRFSSSDTGEGTVSPVSLRFNALNWNTPETVTVTGVNDAMADGDQNYNIITAAASSNDPDYNGLNPSDVSVTNLDNDFRLTANVVGGGSLTLLPGTINCGTSCIEDFVSGTEVTLRTAIFSGWAFDSWSGDCSGTSSLTTVVMDADKSCTANMRRTLLLDADFQGDVANEAPDVNLPGDPTGDRLTLDESAGTIFVQQVVLGNQTLKYAILNQVAGQTGGLNLSAIVAGTPPTTGRYRVRWDSVASRIISFASLVIRDSGGNILMNISYRPNNILDLNDTGTGGLPNWGTGFQSFEVIVNLDTGRIDNILIDGQQVDVNFPLPFRQSAASDLARFSFELGGTSAQSYGLDNINITEAP